MANEGIPCSQCGRALTTGPDGTTVASISGGVMGDEYIESWYFCDTCKVWTVEIYHDRFCGEDSISYRGPVPEAAGRQQVAIIRRCDEPWSKRCRCDAHHEYFGDWLD